MGISKFGTHNVSACSCTGFSSARLNGLREGTNWQGFGLQLTHFSKILMRHVTSFAIFLLAATSISVATPEGDALRSMITQWNASNLNSWVGSDPCKGWDGVKCDPTGSHVIYLNLTNKGLTGSIPKVIGQLTHLQTLDLSNLNAVNVGPTNSIPGPIPDEILSTSLSHFTMFSNNLGEKVPDVLAKLPQLTYVNLHSSGLWGGLPSEFANLKYLQKVIVWDNSLTGFIPDSWKVLTTLENLGLGMNKLSGEIPDWIWTLPNLKIMSLSRNQMQGPFPTIPTKADGTTNFSSLQLDCNFFNGTFPNHVPPNITYEDNCFSNETDGAKASDATATEYTPQACKRDLTCQGFQSLLLSDANGCAPCPSSQVLVDTSTCTCGKQGASKSVNLGAVVGGSVGGAVLVLLALLGLISVWRHKRDARFAKHSVFGRQIRGTKESWDAPKGMRRFTLQELEKATGQFDESHYIGSGGFGRVYYGTLEDGKMVAIKGAGASSLQGQMEFRNELLLLSRLHHRHLVILEGFCDEDGLQILVYEFMRNGNLYEHVFGKNEVNTAPLDAYQRLEIAVGIARGLEYLHSYANPPVIHRDVKPTNVLLDENMVAKLADFGISKVSLELETHVSTRPAGTPGYLDPEYFLRRQLTTASDVYGFGAVLLELVTGQHIIDHKRHNEYNLIEWVKPRLSEGGVKAIVDPMLNEDYNERMYKDMADVALMCISFDKDDRPSMKVVLSLLEPHVRKPSLRRSASYGWSRANSFSLKDSNFLNDIEQPDHPTDGDSSKTYQGF